MDIQETKELSFDTQDFPKEVWVFDADNLDQGTEISHLMMSHAEEYTKDELLVICRKAAMVIDQLRTDLAKAQAVPERTNQTFKDWLSDSENTKVYFGGYRERANEFAHQAWMASLKAKLPKDKILMPRSLDQKHIDYVVHQLAISSGASLISEVYECLIEAQEPANE